MTVETIFGLRRLMIRSYLPWVRNVIHSNTAASLACEDSIYSGNLNGVYTHTLELTNLVDFLATLAVLPV